LGLAQGAIATPAVQSGAGTLSLSPPTLLSARIAGTNFISTQSGTLSLDGAIAGTGTITVGAVDHTAIGETLTATWSAPATVDARSGVVNIHFEGKDNGTFRGTFTADGSAGLEGFHGQGRFSGSDATGQGSYTLSYVN
jgi:hypothetical protein